MDDLEDRATAADDRNDKREAEWDSAFAERREEKPAVEPYDPYFGRKPEGFSWFGRASSH